MIDIAARVTLFPVLAWQGYLARKRCIKLPDASGRREGITGTGPILHMLILGDSSAAGVGASHQDEALLGQMRKRLSQTNTVHWTLDAKTGATTASTLQRALDRPIQHFDVVSVSLGVNDITGLVPLPVWLKRYDTLLTLLNEKFEASVICVSGIPKMEYFPLLPQPLRWVMGAQARRFDRYLRKLVARRPECRFVALDFEPDPTLMSPMAFTPVPKFTPNGVERFFERSVRTFAK